MSGCNPLLSVFRVAQVICVMTLGIGTSACASPGEVDATESDTVNLDEDTAAYWQVKGSTALQAALARKPIEGRAKGIVLFVGDGMGVATITAGRIYAGQVEGRDGESNLLSFDRFPHTALIKTYNVNQQTPDSAGTMSAIITGVKTDAGLISVTGNTPRGDCRAALANAAPTLLEQLEAEGWATGIVSTARLSHATPAATYSHAPERGWEDDSAIPKNQRGKGCKDIAAQLIDFPVGDGLEVALGGGRRHFLPRERDGAAYPDPEEIERAGWRLDGRHLGEEWQAKRPAARWIWNQAQFDALDIDTVGPVLGIFNFSHMQYELDRENDPAGEPSLSDMTATAIRLLSRGDRPFFLMVESGRIDHAHHATNAKRAFADTAELSKAVQIADEMTDDSDTLILVTADHSHVMTIAGYATRDNDVLDVSRGNDDAGNPTDEPELDKAGQPYTTISYANGRGGRMLDEAVTAGGGEVIYDSEITEQRRLDLTAMDTTDDGYHQESLVPTGAETHGGEDVALYAKGPWAHLLSGTQEQSYIYYVMRYAACGECEQ
ncbi:MAG: alkaline phosphatase [Woeseiaceae bacterium]